MVSQGSPSGQPLQEPQPAVVQSQLAEDGTTVLTFADGLVVRVPSALMRDAMGRGVDLPTLFDKLGDVRTNALLAAILGELVSLRRIAEIANDLNADDLADSGLVPA